MKGNGNKENYLVMELNILKMGMFFVDIGEIMKLMVMVNLNMQKEQYIKVIGIILKNTIMELNNGRIMLLMKENFIKDKNRVKGN